ncbi:MAG: ARMT1-like domain-containing protein [Eubacteriales bacterium]|nr:ARMT1-like domain-containing protein [Eubacteriales bacterium]
MSIAMDAACLQCSLRRNLETAQSLGPAEEAMEFARDLMGLYLAGPKDVPSTWYTPKVTQLLHERYGLEIDRFRQEKLDSNALVLSHMEDIRQRVMGAEDPVLAGLQFAILGNYLDFSALQGQVSFEKFTEMLDTAGEMQFDMAVFERFCRDLKAGKRLLYLTDNAGEIGFDRIFAEAISAAYPHIDITFCVRGGPALNDATREDAAAVGIPFQVIDNGNLIPGTQLDELGTEAKQALEEADVILAKGMANVETMLGCGYNIYYAFLVKCQRFVNLFGKPLMTPMLVREQKES